MFRVFVLTVVENMEGQISHASCFRAWPNLQPLEGQEVADKKVQAMAMA